MSKTRTNKEKLYDIVKKPHITEKSMTGVQLAQYTFIVDKDATKVDIANAVEKLFEVKVLKVNTISVKGKKTAVPIFAIDKSESDFSAGYDFSDFFYMSFNVTLFKPSVNDKLCKHSSMNILSLLCNCKLCSNL